LLSQLACLPVATADEAQEQAKQLEQLRKHIDSLKEELGDMRGREAALQRELEKTEKAIGNSAAGMRALEQQRSESQARLAQLEREQREQQAALQRTSGQLARDLRAAYLTGRQGRIRLLLDQQDPATVSRILAYHGYFTRSRNVRMQAMRAAIAELESTGQDILAQQRRLDELLQEQRELAGELVDGQAERNRVLAKLQARMQDKTQEISRLQRDEQRLHKLVESLQQALRDIPPAVADNRPLHERKGKLRWPVAGPVSLRYGSQQAGGKLTSRGMRISAPAGTDVHAIAKGRVAYADWLRGFGLLLIIDHGNDYMSLYGNNRTLYKEVGEWVEGNEVIASVGNSGGQPGSGLYLEMRKKGRPFNPAPWFAGKPSSSRAGR
jgi:septal ring factor EnvC (AmiA/AmiB activator)